MEFFRTQSRKLEQFLFMHEIRFHHFDRGDDGMTTWAYIKTPYLDHVLHEWSIVMERRRTGKTA